MSASLSVQTDANDPNGTAQLYALLGDATVTRNTDDTVTVTSGNNTATVSNNVSLQFLDGTLYTDPASVGGQVYGLYEALTGRAPTAQPFGYWKEVSDQNGGGTQGLTAVANGMLATQEGVQDNGSLSNAAFINQVYENVLHRAVDGSGQAFYESQLNSGTATRAQVALSVVQSSEGQTDLASQMSGGVFQASITGTLVFRLYETLLGRQPDGSGLTYWINTANANHLSANDFINAFMKTPEFASFNAQSNADFVTQIQQNVYGSADATATAYYTQQLNSGAGTRADVITAYEYTTPISAKANQYITNAGIAHTTTTSA